MPLFRCLRSAWLFHAAVLCAWEVSLFASTEKVELRVAGGEAGETIKAAAIQLDVAVVFASGAPIQTRTNAVEGTYSAREALDLMLAGTPLVAVPVSSGKAFGIMSRKTEGEGQVESSDQSQAGVQKSTKTKMKPSKRIKRQKLKQVLSGVAALTAIEAASIYAQSDETAGEDVFELSPFTVEAGDSTGYRANSTLAGSRLKTNLSDLGQSISVLTNEFFEDTGTTDAATALTYTMSTEVAGEQGNFSNTAPGEGNRQATRTKESRDDPDKQQRIRGVTNAELTRGYFQTDIPFDTYNTGAVTISRGPNSLLFGIGSPGGVIDNTPSAASPNKDSGKVSFRIGERSSYRATVDINKVLIQDRLGVRISGLNEETNFKQEPAFDKDKRIYGAITAILAKNENSEFFGPTVLRANYESGTLNSNPLDIVPPGNGIQSWFEKPDLRIFDIVGIDDIGTYDFGSYDYVVDQHPDGPFQPKWFADITKPEGYFREFRTVPGAARMSYFADIGTFIQEDGTWGMGINDPNGNPVHGTQGRVSWLRPGDMEGLRGFPGKNTTTHHEMFLSQAIEAETATTGFAMPSIIDRNVYDNTTRLITGDSNFRDTDFEAHNVTLEQTFLNNKAGIELAWDSQNHYRHSQITFHDNRFRSISIDVMKYIADFQLNPNFGKPVAFVAAQSGDHLGDEDIIETQRDTFRATAFYDLDFTENETNNWLGRHVFSASYNDRTVDRWNENLDGNILAEQVLKEFDRKNCNRRPGDLCRDSPPIYQYLSGPQTGADSWTDVRIDNVITYGTFADIQGQQLNALYWQRWDAATRQELDVFTPGAEPGSYKQWKNGPYEFIQVNLGGDYRSTEFEAQTYTWQSYLFNGNVVGLVGWRTDEQTDFKASSGDFRFESTGQREDENGNRIDPRLLPSAGVELEEQKLKDSKVDTATWSLVAHVPQELPFGAKLSFHLSEAENFQPTTTRNDARGRPAPNPSGTTEEFGFSLDFGSKAHFRVNWYETDSRWVRAGGGNTINTILNAYNQHIDVREQGVALEDLLRATTPECPDCRQDFGDYREFFSSYDEVLAEIRDLIPQDMQGIAELYNDPNDDGKLKVGNSDFNNLNSFKDLVSEGMEIEFVVNPNERWRIGGNIAKTEAISSNSAVVHGDVIFEIRENIENSPLRNMLDRPRSTRGFTFFSTFHRNDFMPMRNQRGKDGSINGEIAEWRANFFTNYKFANDGIFKGFAVGGALRYTDATVTGYHLTPAPELLNDNSRPFYGDEEIQGDLALSYTRKINDRLTWKSQLNIRNLIGPDDYIVIRTNPDGTDAVFRNPPPQDIFWTNSLMF